MLIRTVARCSFRWTAALCLLALVLAGCSSENYPQTTLLPRGDFAKIADDLLDTTVRWALLVFVLVEGVLLYAIFRFRGKPEDPEPRQTHGNTTVEVIWTVIPFAILVGMAIPASKTLIAMETPAEDAELTVKITGYQWKWHYEYVGENLGFFSNLATPRDAIYNRAAKGENYLLEVDRPLILPEDKKVRFLLTSNDVIHAWWVPDLSIKRDAIPGFIHEMWTRIDEPGTYRGQCAELCGRDHAFMPIVVQALPQDEFDSWLMAEKAKTPGSAASAPVAASAAPAAKPTPAPASTAAPAPAAAPTPAEPVAPADPAPAAPGATL